MVELGDAYIPDEIPTNFTLSEKQERGESEIKPAQNKNIQESSLTYLSNPQRRLHFSFSVTYQIIIRSSNMFSFLYLFIYVFIIYFVVWSKTNFRFVFTAIDLELHFDLHCGSGKSLWCNHCCNPSLGARKALSGSRLHLPGRDSTPTGGL